MLSFGVHCDEEGDRRCDAVKKNSEILVNLRLACTSPDEHTLCMVLKINNMKFREMSMVVR